MQSDHVARDRRVHIRLPMRLYADVRAVARQHGMTITGLIEDTLRERIRLEIDKQEPESI